MIILGPSSSGTNESLRSSDIRLGQTTIFSYDVFIVSLGVGNNQNIAGVSIPSSVCGFVDLRFFTVYFSSSFDILRNNTCVRDARKYLTII